MHEFIAPGRSVHPFQWEEGGKLIIAYCTLMGRGGGLINSYMAFPNFSVFSYLHRKVPLDHSWWLDIQADKGSFRCAGASVNPFTPRTSMRWPLMDSGRLWTAPASKHASMSQATHLGKHLALVENTCVHVLSKKTSLLTIRYAKNPVC